MEITSTIMEEIKRKHFCCTIFLIFEQQIRNIGNVREIWGMK